MGTIAFCGLLIRSSHYTYKGKVTLLYRIMSNKEPMKKKMSQLTGHRRQFCLRTVIFSKMYDSLQDSKDTESVSLGEQCVMPTVEGSQRKVLI